MLAEKKESLDFSVKVSWSAFNEEALAIIPRPKCLSALMPLIDENINSLAMVRHTMKLIWKAVNHLNPGQIPVITADQPVYALGKQVQWQFPEFFGEDKFVFMMGGLHIEMAILSMIGDWLQGSEWSELLVAAQIHSCGTADSILSASHVKRSRYAHQVSLAALHLLMKMAFSKEIEERSEMSYGEWVTYKREKSAQFTYWQTVFDLEALLLLFVRSIRLANFDMFVDALEQIIPWMFALDHVHYSRWLPVFVQNLKELPLRHPEVHKQFLKGKFTVQKTNRKFSCISDDQAHEQNNKVIKDDGGAIGILHSPKALMRWMVGGPEVARMISEYNESIKDDLESRSHHENTVAFEKRFRKDVAALVDAFEKEGNPFEEEDDVLVMAVSKTMMNEKAVRSVRDARKIGEDQYAAFVNERLITTEKSIHDVIKRNKLSLFREKNSVVSNKSKLQVTSLKQDCSLYASLYIACQTRECDLDEFFSHENHSYPPSLSLYGKIRQASKSDAIKIFSKYAEAQCEEPNVTALVIDGAALVQMIPPRESATFGDYCRNELTSQLLSKVRRSSITRLDIVFDFYREKSIKGSAREKRGTGTRIRVSDSTPITRKWRNFLRVNENKAELFRLIARICTTEAALCNTQVVVANDDDVTINNEAINKEQISPCNHEEADTRMFVHVKSLSNLGHQRVVIKTVDTDVIVIAISLFRQLGLVQLWIEFGTGKATHS